MKVGVSQDLSKGFRKKYKKEIRERNMIFVFKQFYSYCSDTMHVADQKVFSYIYYSLFRRQ